jgi:hypothetical protein
VAAQVRLVHVAHAQACVIALAEQFLYNVDPASPDRFGYFEGLIGKPDSTTENPDGLTHPSILQVKSTRKVETQQDLGIWNHLGVVVNWLLGACEMHLGKHLG